MTFPGPAFYASRSTHRLCRRSWSRTPVRFPRVRTSTAWMVMHNWVDAERRLVADKDSELLAGFAMTATRERPGTALRSSSSSSSSLGLVSVRIVDIPVVLLPGCARLLTRPLPTGSEEAPMTIAMVDVARCAAAVATAPAVTMASTPRRTSSSAGPARRSGQPLPTDSPAEEVFLSCSRSVH